MKTKVLLVITLLLAAGCGDTYVPTPNTNTNPYNTNPYCTPGTYCNTTANPYANNPYGGQYGNSGYGNYWGQQGTIVNGVLTVRDLNGNVIYTTTQFQNLGNYATYTTAGGQVVSISLMGPTYPYYGSGAMNNPWAYNSGFYYYPYYNNSYYMVGSSCWNNRGFYSFGGFSYVYFTGSALSCF